MTEAPTAELLASGQPRELLQAATAVSWSIVALVDIDDFVVSQLARGDEWAANEIARVEAIVRDETAEALSRVVVQRLEPDEWIIVLGGEVPAALQDAAGALAERLRARVEDAGGCTATISLGRVAQGPDQVEQSLSDAVHANQRKLVLGGNRVIAAAPDLDADGEHRPSPERIEHELSHKLREGDQEGALQVLKDWVTTSAELEGVTPEVLRSWLAAEILFALNVVGEHRLSDGSMDWLEIFGQTSFDELLSMRLIHEQSYLVLWLERLFRRIFEQADTPRTSGRHILRLVEAYIQEHYAENLSLTKVAQAVFVSPFYISHLFHRELDTTFLKYLTAIRIAKARQLLLGTTLQVSEIGTLVGYRTPKNFRCAFKRVVGVTPTEFRGESGSGAGPQPA